MVEFVLATALLIVPLVLGVMVIGLSLIRAIHVGQVNRDTGHMFSPGVDFSGAAQQNMVRYLAGSLDFSAGGKGVVILSAVQLIGPNDCSNCANLGLPVFTQRIIIGNAGLRASAFGAPSPALVDPATGSVENYLTDAGARAASAPVAGMQPSEIVYVSETYYKSSDYDIAGYLTGSGVYALGLF